LGKEHEIQSKDQHILKKNHKSYQVSLLACPPPDVVKKMNFSKELE